MQHTDLSSYIASFSYAGIFLWFAIGEQLTPVPEELFLISLGYIAKSASLHPLLAGVAALSGLLATDNFLFYISMKGNKYSQQLLNKVKSKLLDGMRARLKRNAVKTLVLMALLPKLRFLSPVISGIGGISWRLFLIVNSLATAFYVTVYMVIGIVFHNQLGAIFHKVERVQHLIFIGFMAVLAVVAVIMIRRLVNKRSA